MFTPDEARVALQLSHQPQSLETIAGRTATEFPPEQTARLLESMFAKGSIGWKERGGIGHWFLMPLVVGMYEGQDGEPTPDFVADAAAYMRSMSYSASLLAVSPPQMRTIPINQSIPVEHNVATYDQIRALVAETRGPFVVLKCLCREQQVLKNKPCKQTARLETCMAFNDTAAMIRRRSHGREVNRDEALEILQRNEADGLVLQPANARRPDFVCSCCGCCCGMLSLQKMLPHPLDFWTTNFRAEIDDAACKSCGKCVSRCQIGAVTVRRPRGGARINPNRCIGCGLCVTTCPSHAIRLAKRVPETVPPESEEALQAQIAARKKSPWARRRMLARVLLRMKQ